jgi:hypothetical protein
LESIWRIDAQRQVDEPIDDLPELIPYVDDDTDDEMDFRPATPSAHRKSAAPMAPELTRDGVPPLIFKRKDDDDEEDFDSMPLLVDYESDSDDEEDNQTFPPDTTSSTILFPLVDSATPTLFSAKTVSRHTIYQDTGASISIANPLDLTDFVPCSKPRFANGIGGAVQILGYGQHAGLGGTFHALKGFVDTTLLSIAVDNKRDTEGSRAGLNKIAIFTEMGSIRTYLDMIGQEKLNHLVEYLG